ncbi:fungal-specific transcription factor domain-domain-containing protein [Naematelia encephala]|uniref:Fungal-specific transcription factor domain-domain-containing protein n=1 Tax=Naematelia encephala TaxID=71784 RepID=A0A1Y2BL42_9TREE|nr:fungal-specific transcription factor domain-domain-containing protein [Naematelia encephala]
MNTPSDGDTSDHPVKKRKKYISRACTVCRRRRMRCNGQPRCQTCTTYDEECIYDPDHDGRKPATKQYVEALVNRVRQLEDMLAKRPENGNGGLTSINIASTPGPVTGPAIGASGVLRVDDDSLTHHGPSSAYMLLPDSAARTRGQDIKSSSGVSVLYSSNTLQDNFGSRQEYDISAISWNRHLPPDVIPNAEVHQEVLDIFFSYLNDWCRPVDELDFLAGLFASVTSSSPLARNAQYSPLLHNSILALAISRCPHLFAAPDETELPGNAGMAAAAFAQRARWLFEEEAVKPMISTAQGLMLLGSYHSVAGSLSLGWFYESMGVRMAQTMGLNADCSSLVARGVISPEMRIIRDRALWTVYMQDQLWALFIGRTPNITQDDFETPLPSIDSTIDAMPWMNHVERRARRKGRPWSSSSLSWASSTFRWTCHLMLLADRLHQALYRMRSRHNEAARQTVVSQLHLELGTWLIDLPSPLRVDSSRSSAPPPHIIMMHGIHRYLQILLHRPRYTQPHASGDVDRELAVRTCNVAAVEILHLLEMYDHCAGLRYATTGLINVVFAAGTIHLLDLVQSEKSSGLSMSRILQCIDSLQRMSWPSALAGADILRHMLDEWNPTSLARVSVGQHRSPSPPHAMGQEITGSETSSHNPEQSSEVERFLARLGWMPPVEMTNPGVESAAPPLTSMETPAVWEDFGDTLDMQGFQLAPFAMHDWNSSQSGLADTAALDRKFSFSLVNSC